MRKSYWKEYYQKNKEKLREKYRKYYYEHPEKIAEYQKRYREKNRDKLNKYILDWKEKNRGRYMKDIKIARRKKVDKLREQGVINAWNVVNYGKEPKYKEGK